MEANESGSLKLREALAPLLEETVDLRMLFHVALEELPRVFDMRSGTLWVRDSNRQKFLGPRDLGLDAHDGFRNDVLVKGQLLETPLWAPDRTAADPAFSSLFDPTIKAFLLVPLRDGPTTLGLLAFASNEAQPGDDRVPKLASEAASILLGALRRADAQFRLQEDFKLQQALLDLVRQMAGDPNLVSFCQRSFRIVEKLVPVDAMFVGVRRDDGLYDAVLETDLDDRDRRIFYPVPRLMEPGRSRVIETIDQHSYVLINRSAEELRELDQGSRPDQPQHLVGNSRRRSASLLYVPVWSGDEFTGVVSVQSYKPNIFRHEDARRLLVVSNYFGLAFRLHRKADGRT